MKKLAVVGSRSFADYVLLKAVLDGFDEPLHIISGGARGADKLSERWARETGNELTVFVADWEGLGKSAGFVRNRKMAEECDECIAFWDESSRGTAHMMALVSDLNKPLLVIPCLVNPS